VLLPQFVADGVGFLLRDAVGVSFFDQCLDPCFGCVLDGVQFAHHRQHLGRGGKGIGHGAVRVHGVEPAVGGKLPLGDGAPSTPPSFAQPSPTNRPRKVAKAKPKPVDRRPVARKTPRARPRTTPRQPANNRLQRLKAAKLDQIPWTDQPDYNAKIGPQRGLHLYREGKRSYALKERLDLQSKMVFREVEDRIIRITMGR